MEGNWSVRRTSQKPHIDFRVRVWLGYSLDLRAYATVSLGPGPGPGPGERAYSQPQEQFYSSNFSPLPSWNSSEAVICIYIRSVDQARALLAQGVCACVCVLECCPLWLLKRVRRPPTYCACYLSSAPVIHEKMSGRAVSLLQFVLPLLSHMVIFFFFLVFAGTIMSTPIHSTVTQ